MNPLPRVTESSRERISREFEERGPDVCLAEIVRDLERNNPEFLAMASKCAKDVGDSSKIMMGFGMFYRVLIVQSPAPAQSLLNPLPRVTPATRDLLVREIDENGPEAFTVGIIDDLELNNPELLQMAHNFASDHEDYLGVMQGFALLYRSLIVQSAADRDFLQ